MLLLLLLRLTAAAANVSLVIVFARKSTALGLCNTLYKIYCMATWRKDHLELLFLCQSFNSSSDVGKTAQALNLSLNADSRSMD